MLLTIGESEIWISCDDKGLTVGYGLTHTHYKSEFDDLHNSIHRFFNLMAIRIRITI